MGQLKILELRARALGEDFDLRALNDRVLASGALPLAVLDQVVTDWIDRGIGKQKVQGSLVELGGA